MLTLADAGNSGTQAPIWVVFVAAAIPGAAAVVAAYVASRFERRSKASEREAQRLRDNEAAQAEKISNLEAQNVDRKYAIYERMIETLRKMLDPKESGQLLADQSAFLGSLSKFSSWVVIYGSDEAVRLFQRFMQVAFADPPPKILIRIYAEFMVAVRRDLGHPDTSVSLIHLLPRITDIYKDEWREALDIPFEDLCRTAGWTPPWHGFETL